MRALVVYESIFGNTRRVAEAIAEGIAPGAEVTVVEIAEAPTDVAGFDFVVVGGPTHAWSMSRKITRKGAREQAKARGIEAVSTKGGMREWLRALRPGPPIVPIAVFDTAVRQTGWFPTGSAARKAESKVVRKGHRLLASAQQFRVSDMAGPLEEGELERARAWGEGLAAQLPGTEARPAAE